MPETENSLISRLLESPDLYPASVRVPNGDIEFFAMSAPAYRRTSFLDHRISRESDAVEHVPFRAVGRVLQTLAKQPTQYIFHNAFACSTLLTRYLDSLEGPLVLREPNSLYEVATLLRFEGSPMLRPLVGISWADLYAFVVRLVGRRYRKNYPTIVKPTDGCNNLMHELVGNSEDNRAVFIYAPFERFLASVLRHQPRHEWAKVRARELLLDERRRTGTLPVVPETLDVPQCAALVWSLHTDQFLRCSALGGQGVYLAFEADALIRAPEDTLWALVRHFNLDHTRDQVAESVRNTDVEAHAKAADEQYDTEQRERDFATARAQFKSHIDHAADWLRRLNPSRDPLDPLPGALT